MKFKGYFASVGLLLAAGAPAEQDLVWAQIASPNGGTSVAIWNPQDTSIADDTVTYSVPPNAARGRWSIAPPVATPGAYPGSYTSNPYLSQATWFVNGTLNGPGNDLNDGQTAATPLRTCAEIQRRWGPNPVLKQTTTINVIAFASDDQVQWAGVATQTAANQLILRGTVTAGATLGNISAVSVINHATADGATYVTIGAISWPAQGTRVRISGGARDGAVAYVETANTAAGQSRLSPFTKIPAGTAGPMQASQLVTPQVGDTIIVETIPVATLPMQTRGEAITWIVEDCKFSDDAAFTFTDVQSASNYGGTFNRCAFVDGLDINGGIAVQCNGCNTGSILSIESNTAQALACLMTGFFGTCANGNIVIDLDTICSASGFSNQVESGMVPVLYLGNVAFYNVAGPCVTFFGDGILRQRPLAAVDGVLYGIGNQFVLKARTNVDFYMQDPSKILIVGTTAFATVAGHNITNKLYPLDNHGNVIGILGETTSPETANVAYQVAAVFTARNVCLTNVVNLAQYTVAGNDGVTNVEGDIVVLLSQTGTPAQNGPYLVGTVVAGVAPLTRTDFFFTGAKIRQGMQIRIGAESSVYGGSMLTSDVATTAKVVDTDDPLFIPDRIVQQVILNNGTFTISNVPIRASAKVACAISRTTPNTTAATIQYNPVTITPGEIGTGSVVINAQVAAGTINAADLSTLNVAIIQQ